MIFKDFVLQFSYNSTHRYIAFCKALIYSYNLHAYSQPSNNDTCKTEKTLMTRLDLPNKNNLNRYSVPFYKYVLVAIVSR